MNENTFYINLYAALSTSGDFKTFNKFRFLGFFHIVLMGFKGFRVSDFHCFGPFKTAIPPVGAAGAGRLPVHDQGMGCPKGARPASG